MPKVSVIIPTYNRAESLCLAITNVLNQTFQDFEIIVVDDSSQDHTQEVVNSFDDKRIKYIRHERNKGVAAARNIGVFNAKGNYIAFLDDDDEWFPEKLKKQFDLLEASSPIVGVVYTGNFVLEGSSKKVLAKVLPKKRGNIFDEIFIQGYIAPTSTIFLRRACFEKVGSFDESLKFGEDYDMWLRISKEFQFEYINEVLANYLVYNDKQSLSDNYEAIISSIEIQLKKYASLFASDYKAYSQRCQVLGILHCFIGNARKGKKYLIKAIALSPKEIRQYYNLSLSLLGARNFKKLKESIEMGSLRLREKFRF